MVKELRQAAWERYESLPWPVRTDEEWRRTDPKLVSISATNPKPEEGSFRAGWEPLPPELIQKGVLLTDLAAAARQFPELVERHLFQSGEPAGMLKFVALHQAMASQGLFCRVPDGVQVELPLRSWIELTGGPTVFPHVLVVVGRGAELTLIDERRSVPETTGPVLSDEMVELQIQEGGLLRYVHLQRWNTQTAELFTQRAVLEKDARLIDVTVGLGGRFAKATVETLLRGPGARSELMGILLGSGSQHYDFHTLQDHQAPNTTSDLLYKSALAGQAQMVYTGLIRIARQARNSDAYQANRNLLLSQGAKADSIPMLEIETDAVRCTHGVAVGPVDEEQAFYLMSRGLPREEAEHLIIEGFFEQILRRIPLAELREQLASEIAGRLNERSTP